MIKPRSPSSPSFSRGRLYRAFLPRLESFTRDVAVAPTGAGLSASGAVSCMQPDIQERVQEWEVVRAQ